MGRCWPLAPPNLTSSSLSHPQTCPACLSSPPPGPTLRPILRESVSHTQVSAPAPPPQGAASPHTARVTVCLPPDGLASPCFLRLESSPISNVSTPSALSSSHPSTDVPRVSNCARPRAWTESRNIMGALPHGTWPSRDTDAHQRCPCRHVAQLCRVRRTALGGLGEPPWGWAPQSEGRAPPPHTVRGDVRRRERQADQSTDMLSSRQVLHRLDPRMAQGRPGSTPWMCSRLILNQSEHTADNSCRPGCEDQRR